MVASTRRGRCQRDERTIGHRITLLGLGAMTLSGPYLPDVPTPTLKGFDCTGGPATSSDRHRQFILRSLA
jgi:hypothetical protein